MSIPDSPIEISKTALSGFWRLTARISIARGLSGTQYLPFLDTKKFAGQSSDGRLLSFDEPGDGTLHGCKIAKTPPPEWLPVPTVEGVIITQANPTLVLVPDATEYKIDRLYIDPKYLAPRYQLVKNLNDVDKTGYNICYGHDNLLLQFYSRYPSTKLVQPNNWNIRLMIPEALELSGTEWEQLNQVLINGKSKGTYNQTLPLNADRDYLWFKGSTLPEIEERWGITGAPKVSANKDGLALGFKRIKVVDPQKAVKANPILAYAKEVTLNTVPDHHVWVETPDLLQMPRLIQDNPFITCCSNFSHTAFPKDNPTLLGQVEIPLYHHNHFALIAAHKLDQFFIPARLAARQHDLRGLQRIHVRTEDPAKQGAYVAIKDLPPQAATYDAVQVSKELSLAFPQIRPAIITKLCLKNKQKNAIEKHLQIKTALLQDKLVPALKSPLLPALGKHECIHWLSEQKQVTICPLTDTKYLPNYASIDEIARIPGFVDFLNTTTLDAEFIKKLILSDAARTAVISEKL